MVRRAGLITEFNEFFSDINPANRVMNCAFRGQENLRSRVAGCSGKGVEERTWTVAGAWRSVPGVLMEATCPVLVETIRVDLIASLWIQGRGCLRWVLISGLRRALPGGIRRRRGAVGGSTGRSGGPGRRARRVGIHSCMGSLAVLCEVLKWALSSLGFMLVPGGRM